MEINLMDMHVELIEETHKDLVEFLREEGFAFDSKWYITEDELQIVAKKFFAQEKNAMSVYRILVALAAALTMSKFENTK